MSNVYNPNLQHATLKDKISDRFLGTDKVDTINNANRFEYEKATNINKYSWNQQGMLKAGINPLAASAAGGGAIGSVAGTSAGSDQTTDMGELVEFANDMVKDVLHELSPGEILRQTRQFAHEMAPRTSYNNNRNASMGYYEHRYYK